MGPGILKMRSPMAGAICPTPERSGVAKMGALLRFPQPPRRRRQRGSKGQVCEIVIFPGVRIERHDLDLSHRVRPTAGRTNFGALDGNGRPRKTS
jgi:hypothetical protein